MSQSTRPFSASRLLLGGALLLGLAFMGSLWLSFTRHAAPPNRIAQATPHPALPPLDATLPPRRETAAFALG